MLDGLDLRETLRDQAANPGRGRIHVREDGRAPGGAGAVVLIFDADARAYPYRMTWLGEHDEESDMAFYATNPGAQVVGPGIVRVTYGALMMTMPPRRVFDVWLDPDYRAASSAAEVLVRAAVDYSTEPLVVHVAARKPRATWRQYAAQQGKRLVHLPLGSLSPPTIKRIRVVHLLAGTDKRDIAGRYIH